MSLEIYAQPLTKQSFSSFGEVIECAGANDIGMNQGTLHRFHDLANIDLGDDPKSRAVIAIAQCKKVITLPLQLEIIERHPKGSQAFIPFFDDPFYVVVAPKGELDHQKIQVFKTNGKQGINYALGVWHMPIIANKVGHQYLVIDRGGPGNNCEEVNMSEFNIIIKDED